MPELPEVETIKNELSPHIVGRSIVGVDVFWDRMVRQPSVQDLKADIAGQRIVGVGRRANTCC